MFLLNLLFFQSNFLLGLFNFVMDELQLIHAGFRLGIFELFQQLMDHDDSPREHLIKLCSLQAFKSIASSRRSVLAWL
ncbi:TPA: hypothetical protein MIQ23_13735 [Klebsiella pneumoniae]|nr:hypothetical protein CXB26_10175 [Klebsiella pneumoniae]AUD28136.1 hypothetical protein CXB24_10200 [Klebsiella pneumoniae]AUD33684.1 hypothetical protein CXB25_10190 [Klebsiella pneumoniae]HBY1169524.1 hypothetical protein [Klebsiella pneumoniae]HBY1180987.1 hypothetical protein [Klebsiella pneumoniae]